MQSALYNDDAEVRRLTEQVVGSGQSIFQIHKLAPTEGEHVAKLLELFCPPQDALVLDAGCGIGEVARLMKQQRPDLKFALLNISAAQLAMCPYGFDTIEADFHKVPRTDSTFDAVMFNYSLGHGEVQRVLWEAARLLKRKGILFIYDVTGWDSTRLMAALDYKAYRVADVWGAALDAGFRIEMLRYPRDTSVTDFLKHISDADYAQIFRGISPVVYRFVKC